jgi:hypothetical protein
MEKENFKGPERRSCNRIIYNPKERPRLKIDAHFLEVVDISEKGLRLINDKNIELDVKIQGTLTFLSGESVDIEGSIIWQEGNTLGLQFKDLIPSEIIYKEQRHILVSCR